jgi:hypothetical protein
MAATNRYRNVTVAWTPQGGSLVAMTGIKDFDYDEGNSILQEAADFDSFPTVGGVTMAMPKITLSTLDAFALYATLGGQKGTLAVTVRDHYNGATSAGGGKTLTMSNAFLGERTIKGAFNQLATQSVTFHSTSTDGSTHPVAITAL